MINEYINELEKSHQLLIEKGVKNTPQYRAFIKFKQICQSEGLFLDPELIAAAAVQSGSFENMPDEITDEQIEKLAKVYVGTANLLYIQLYEDLVQNKADANAVLKILLTKA